MNVIRSIRGIRGVILLVATGMSLLRMAHAQCSFSSGSTGADGAFNPTNSMPGTGWSISNNVVTVTNKPDGVFNFTSVYIETNWVVKFTHNTLNTPVHLLATTNVTIKGTIDVSGVDVVGTSGSAGGPGGFDGGAGGEGLPEGGNGFGPGGGVGDDQGTGGSFGAQTSQYSLPPYGTIEIQPLIGGSGGGGATTVNSPGGGAGGGGALLIASSKTIDVTGTIQANGGAGDYWAAGDGSGGAIKLMANTLQGEGIIRAISSFIATSGNDGGAGRIRLEACENLRLTLTEPPATFGSPATVFLVTNPTIRVVSIAGTNTPAMPAGSLTVPDVYLPSGFVNPATIKVTASNINVGTSFKVVIAPAYGTNLIGSNTLVGAYAFSSNTVSMSVYTDRVWRVNAVIDYIPKP
jgi:hypothetical protein